MSPGDEPDVLHNGWTETHLRDVLPQTSERVQEVLRYIAEHPDSDGREIGAALGLAGSHGVGQVLRGMNPLGEDAGIRDGDGTFRWPLMLGAKRDGHSIYEMHPAVRAVVLDVLGGSINPGCRPFERGEGWTEAVRWAGRLLEHPDFDVRERVYKLKIGSLVAQAKEALLGGDPGWELLLRQAFRHKDNNLTSFRVHEHVVAWARDAPDVAAEALRALWEPGDESGIGSFFEHLPTEIVRGTGTRVSIASFLLLGVDATAYPFFKPTVFSDLRRVVGVGRLGANLLEQEGATRPEDLAARLGLTGLRVRTFLRETYPRSESEAGQPWVLTSEQVRAVIAEFDDVADPQNEIATHAEWTLLLEEFRSRLVDAGSEVRDLLDVQGLAWWLTRLEAPEEWSEDDRIAFAEFQGRPVVVPDPPLPPLGRVRLPPVTLGLARDLHLPEPWLAELVDLLDEKRQVVLYGPPGTGKTFIAQHLGRHIERHGGTYRLIQFHPSYTYEDFFEGYRPEARADGTLAFRLVPGALRQLVATAEERPDVPHVLIIDEINRGNIAKIFGELYFLLEYRDQAIRLQYSADTEFRLPENLFVIGTMNTADRSIALVDGALRRRFYFEALTPTRHPVDGVLASWLERHGLDPEPAQVLDELNRMIGDPDFAVGPSYFMTGDGSQPDLQRIWKHGVLPLLEEQYYGSGRDVGAEFALSAIRKRFEAPAPEAATNDAD